MTRAGTRTARSSSEDVTDLVTGSVANVRIVVGDVTDSVTPRARKTIARAGDSTATMRVERRPDPSARANRNYRNSAFRLRSWKSRLQNIGALIDAARGERARSRAAIVARESVPSRLLRTITQ
ncbi:MAG: hypothetical protein KA297_00465 [Kofleriaceae bacterium]|nr:hypothetical protein [Kofleriaceae bacterium]